MVQEVEQRNPVAPGEDLRVVERTVTTSRPVGNGESELEVEVKALGGSGDNSDPENSGFRSMKEPIGPIPSFPPTNASTFGTGIPRLAIPIAFNPFQA